jgi:hypothetical protein
MKRRKLMAARKRKRRLRGYAAPFLVREPLLLRFCAALVDNLTLILRMTFVFGSIWLVRNILDHYDTGIDGETMIAAEREAGVAGETDTEVLPKEPTLLIDGVKLALNCTRSEFRNAHYAECKVEDSEIYRRTTPADDERGQLTQPSQTMYADLIQSTPIDEA